MNSALLFHAKLTLTNTFKQALKRPLKFIGMVAIGLYFIFLPFTLQSTLSQFQMNTPAGFVLITTAMTMYISMPATLSYFKRKGVVFRKQDIHFMFSTPIPPKQILIYALFKQAYLTLIMQIGMVIGAIFVFQIPLATALTYGVVDIVFSSLMQYSLAVIMYGSETMKASTKKYIKWGIYAVLAALTIFIVVFAFQNKLSVDSISTLMRHPFVLLIPFFGWQLGWLNFMVFGATWASVIASILFISSGIILAIIAYKMKCTGEYYEEALAFSENLATVEAKKGDVTFAEAMGKKRKIHNVTGQINGTGAQVIFSRQILERRRSSRFFLGFGDLIYLIAGLALGITNVFMSDKIPPDAFFAIIVGVTMYMTVFFSPQPSWKNEFETASLFVIPDTIMRKLIYATMLEHFIGLVRAILLTVPAGILIKASVSDILLAILCQVLIRVMLTHVSVITREFTAAKLGKTFAQLANILVTLLVILIPAACLSLSFLSPSFMSFGAILVYTAAMTLGALYISSKMLTNIESLRS